MIVDRYIIKKGIMMKLKLLLITGLVLCSLKGFSQKKMILHFKDGSTQTGYVTFKKKELKFQENLKAKKGKIAYEVLDSASSYKNPRAKRASKPKTVYILPTGKEGKQYRVYDIVKQGKVNLYKYSTYAGYSGLWVPSGGGGSQVYIPTGGGGPVTIYGIKRPDESFVTILGNKDTSIAFVKVSDSFKKQGSAYFEDCSALSQKIEKKEKGFTKKDLKRIVDYYNTQCQ